MCDGRKRSTASSLSVSGVSACSGSRRTRGSWVSKHSSTVAANRALPLVGGTSTVIADRPGCPGCPVLAAGHHLGGSTEIAFGQQQPALHDAVAVTARAGAPVGRAHGRPGGDGVTGPQRDLARKQGKLPLQSGIGR